MSYSIGGDIGGTKGYFVLVKDRQIVQHHKVDLRDAFEKDSLIEKLTVKGIDVLLEKAGVPYRKVGRCGYGVPGNIKKERNEVEEKYEAAQVISCPNLPALNGVALPYDIYTQYENEGDAVQLINNDANCFALGAYKWLGLDKKYENGICIITGTGVGAGVIINGSLWEGKDVSAGEVGFDLYDDTQILEAVCSGKALERTPVDRKVVDGQTLYRMAREGHAEARKVARDVTIRPMTRLVEHAIHVYAPEFIVFGGSRAKLTRLFAKPLKRSVHQLIGDTVPDIYFCTDPAVNAFGAASLEPFFLEQVRTVPVSAPVPIKTREERLERRVS